MIVASAPARIDLAGGTIDIWPVCFSLGRPAVTVNLAIDLRAEAEVSETADGLLHIRSEDLGEEVRVPAGEVAPGRLGLFARLARHYGVGPGLSVTLRSRVPPRSGLGGSSALAVALAAALARLRGRGLDVRAVQDVEAAHLKSPTGYQDYYPALLGGLNALTAVPGGVGVERLDPGMLEGRLLLVDTGIAHESGLANWEAVRRFFDGDPAVRAAFERIAECAAGLRDALRARDLAGVGAALREEWEARRRLSPAVTNASLDALAEAALRAGALAAKVCGAGGGGCMAILAPDASDPGLLREVERAGGTRVACRPDHGGVAVERVA